MKNILSLDCCSFWYLNYYHLCIWKKKEYRCNWEFYILYFLFYPWGVWIYYRDIVESSQNRSTIHQLMFFISQISIFTWIFFSFVLFFFFNWQACSNHEYTVIDSCITYNLIKIQNKKKIIKLFGELNVICFRF